MMRWIVSTSIQSRLMVAAIAVGLMAYGITQLQKMPVDVLPEFSQPYVEIQTESLGLSAEEVEQLITVPMEQDLLNGVPWLEDIRSESVPGLSSIVLFFEPRNRPDAGTTDGVGAHDSGRRVATRVEATHHAPAAVGDEPGDDRRAFVEIPCRTSKCRCSPVGRLRRV